MKRKTLSYKSVIYVLLEFFPKINQNRQKPCSQFKTPMYTEDGNEMNNTFTRNVVICKNPATCRFSGNEWQEESGVKEGGFFWFGMTNNAIENRVASHEHGIWTRNTGNGKV